MSLAQDCREVVSRYPYMVDCLREGVANYRALARKIKPEVESERGGEVDIEAVTSALRRYAEKLEKGVESGSYDEAKSVLGGARVSLRGNVFVMTATEVGEIEKSRFFHIVKGSEYTTVVTDDTRAEEVRNAVKGEIVYERNDLTGITVEAPEEVNEVPGVLARMFSSLASNEINIVELTSCYDETVIVVDKRDAVKALDTLENLIESE